MHTFSGGTSPATGGAQPLGGLVQAPDGNFYGTTQVGGAFDHGTIYRMTPSGKVKTVHSFSGTGPRTPTGNLTLGPDGALYGTTSEGGRCSFCGTAYKIGTEGGFTVLHRFAAATEGATPSGTLTLATDGNFYGTLYYGGRYSAGALYQMTPAGAVKIIHAFGAVADDGNSPRAPVIQASDGNLYGVTALGGGFGGGTVYRVKIGPRGAVAKVIHSFSSEDLDGYAPATALVQGSDGALYGSSGAGGIENVGTLYRISAQGVFRKLHTFAYGTGALPGAAMIVGSDGALYGTTTSGGAGFSGTVFRMGADGNYTVLHAFDGTDGSAPSASLLEAGDGRLLSTTLFGGDQSAGTLFSLRR